MIQVRYSLIFKFLYFKKYSNSGGPLVLFSNNINDHKLVGVVSWGGDPCARPNEPGVYARVASIRDWIRSISGV